MKFTFSWLREHLETTASASAIAERLTMIGLEVDAVIDRAEGLRDFAAARVIEARAHPNADRLKVCRVETATGEFEVVCGAPNARTGMVGVFAPAGSRIPGTGIDLKKAKIRGVESNGMLLSEREMGVSDEHEGIIELAPGTAIGTPAVAALGLDDVVFDVAVTPNRGDCLGVRGIARDLAAAGLGKLKPLDVAPVPGRFASPIKVRLEFDAEAASACPYFVGRLIRGVSNGASPKWLRDRLEAVGLRPISALVDITNLMTIGLNRPLHAFDADRVRGDLRLRLARPGETLMALNDREYALDGEMTVIADNEGVEALGGIMGGVRTGCTEETTNVFLESAYFDPLRTAATGRRLNLQSDARYRFERGIDPTFLVPGIEVATRFVLELCGGEPSEVVIAGHEPPWRRDIALRLARVHALGGADVAADVTVRILEDLGFAVARADGALKAGVPPWRGDVVGEACLVEEVVRIFGYDKVPTTPLPLTTPLPRPALTPEQRRAAHARRALAARGLNEAVTYSFMPSSQAALFARVPETLRLVNPISADLDVMRPSILPNLLAACGRNADRGLIDAALFEVGPVYRGDGPNDQATVAAGVRFGNARPRTWAAPARAADAFDAKADALSLLEALEVGIEALGVARAAPAYYHPGRSGTLRLGPKGVLAHFGEVHPRVLARLGVRGPAAAFEVFLDALPRRKRKGWARPPLVLAALQPVTRDFAFVVDSDVPAEAVLAAARAADRALVAQVALFDVFRGEGLPAGKKSLAIAVTLQPSEKTLTDADIEAVTERIVAAVAKATGGTLRG